MGQGFLNKTLLPYLKMCWLKSSFQPLLKYSYPLFNPFKESSTLLQI